MNKDYKNYSKPKNQVEEPQIVEEEVSEPKKQMIGVIMDCSSLNIRAKSSINSEIIATVKAGTELLINEDESIGEWYKVCTEAGIEGFCMKRYVSIRIVDVNPDDEIIQLIK